MKTMSFKIITGVNEGYFHSNENKIASEIVGAAWQKIAAKKFSETGIYISAVVNDSRTIYHTDWGCPIGGEVTATITGTANPEFIKDMEHYKNTVTEIAKELKEELKQSTMTVEFKEVDFIYLS